MNNHCSTILRIQLQKKKINIPLKPLVVISSVFNNFLLLKYRKYDFYSFSLTLVYTVQWQCLENSAELFKLTIAICE